MKTKEPNRFRFAPRVRFNWGFHDGARDFRDNRPRTLRLDATHDLKNVGKEFDPDYFRGYSKGLEYARAGTYAENSDPAWLEMVAAGIYSKKDELDP